MDAQLIRPKVVAEGLQLDDAMQAPILRHQKIGPTRGKNLIAHLFQALHLVLSSSRYPMLQLQCTWLLHVGQVGGSSVSTVATGVAKVGIADSAQQERDADPHEDDVRGPGGDQRREKVRARERERDVVDDQEAGHDGDREANPEQASSESSSRRASIAQDAACSGAGG